MLLRREPLTVSEGEAQKVFRLTDDRRPLEYIENDFEDRGEVVVDQATGLMWQKSGSPNIMTYKQAQEYIDKLNQERFAGYSDWRLPTVDELLSLMERDKQSNGLYINPVFDSTQGWCWSADRSSSSSSAAAWLVGFYGGVVYWDYLFGTRYVRGVRS